MTREVEYIEVAVTVHKETDKAYFVSDTGKKKDAVWIAKSLLQYERELTDTTKELTMPMWLAEREGLF